MLTLFRCLVFALLMLRGAAAEPASQSIRQELISALVRHPGLYAACLENLRNQFTAGYRAYDIFDYLNHPQGARPGLRTEQGALLETASPMDVAIEGQGYLLLEGGRLTRDGALRRHGNSLTVNGGIRLLAFTSGRLVPLQIPHSATGLTIARDGTVEWLEREGDGKVQKGPRLAMATVARPRWLEHNGWHLRTTPRSGSASPGWAGDNGLGTFRSGRLEMSNGSALEQMTTAEALRAYAGLGGSL